MSLKGKRVIVTGGSKGLGLGIVKRLCEEGANLIITYNTGDITEAKACAEAAGVEFAAYQADLSKDEEIHALAEKLASYDDIYGLVNNAGICLFENFFEVTPESYETTFNVNMKSVFFLTQKVTEQMVKQGIKGRVVCFSSITALSGSATQVHYGAAKGAVSSFTHMAAEALASMASPSTLSCPAPSPPSTIAPTWPWRAPRRISAAECPCAPTVTLPISPMQ